MDFKPAKLDASARFISVFTVIFLTAMSIFFIFRMPYGWVFATVMMSIILVAYALSVKRYYFEGGKLVIEKAVGKKTIIPLAELESILVVDNFMSLKPLRAFGNGGLFGYYGIYTTLDYGKMSCNLTGLKNVILIKTRNGIHALSPAEPDRFQDYLKNAVLGITGKLETLQPLTPAEKKYANPLILIIPGAIFALTLILVFAFYPSLPDIIASHFDARGLANGWSRKNVFLFMSLMPAAIVFALNILLFFIVRKRSPEPKVTYFVVGLFSLIQLLMAFAPFDIYWFNTRHEHFFSFFYVFIGFLVLFLAAIYIYYRLIKHHQ
jgi:hypothetical protein